MGVLSHFDQVLKTELAQLVPPSPQTSPSCAVRPVHKFTCHMHISIVVQLSRTPTKQTFLSPCASSVKKILTVKYVSRSTLVEPVAMQMRFHLTPEDP